MADGVAGAIADAVAVAVAVVAANARWYPNVYHLAYVLHRSDKHPEYVVLAPDYRLLHAWLARHHRLAHERPAIDSCMVAYVVVVGPETASVDCVPSDDFSVDARALP